MMDQNLINGLPGEDFPHNSAEGEEKEITEPELKVLNNLKDLYMETLKIDLEFQKEIYKLEKRFEKDHLKIFASRKTILDDIKVGKIANIPDTSPLKHFWLTVLKLPFADYISHYDAEILLHCRDVRSNFFNEPDVKFELVFEFEPNEFFTNDKLTKTYYLNCEPDPNDPLSYDGAEIYKCEGCKIEWKDPKYDPRNFESDNIYMACSSFFNFFSPPATPEDDDTSPGASTARILLQNDYELGFYMKERVIPKAVLFFTGEVKDCMSDSEGSEFQGEEGESGEMDTDDVDMIGMTQEELAAKFQQLILNQENGANDEATTHGKADDNE